MTIIQHADATRVSETTESRCGIATIEPRQFDLTTDRGKRICWEENEDLSVTISLGVKATKRYAPSSTGSLVLVSLETDDDEDLIEVQTSARFGTASSLGAVESAIEALSALRDGLRLQTVAVAS